MPPRYIKRMQTQAEAQKHWHQTHHSDPPPYHSVDATPEVINPPSYRRALRQPAPPPPPAYREHQYSHLTSSIDLHSFPDRARILVVGAYSRQGMNIISRLLDQHYRVRGVVSNAKEAAQTAKYFEARHGREHYRPLIIPNLASDDIFDVPASKCAGVVFVAGKSNVDPTSGEETLARVTNVLEAAMRQPRMDRFLYCSPRSEARTDDLQPSVELAIWDWVDSRQPGFALDIGKSTVRVNIVCARPLTSVLSIASQQFRYYSGLNLSQRQGRMIVRWARDVAPLDFMRLRDRCQGETPTMAGPWLCPHFKADQRRYYSHTDVSITFTTNLFC